MTNYVRRFLYYKEHEIEDIEKWLKYSLSDKEMSQLLDGDADLKEAIYDELWLCDDVTGNGSGSYTFDNITAQYNLVGNWHLLKFVTEEFQESNVVESGPEYCDVLIRLHLLDECLDESLK